jgi:hypothetical protein
MKWTKCNQHHKMLCFTEEHSILCSDENHCANYENKEKDDDHRLTLRIPKWLIKRIDIKRKNRLGKISRNLLILEILQKATEYEENEED